MSMNSVCQSFAEDLPKTASGLSRRRLAAILIPLLFIIFEIVRYSWHRIRIVALNFRRHTPPSTSYTLSMTFDEHSAHVEEMLCNREDVQFCIEGLFCQRVPLAKITRDMLAEAVQTHLGMEVRRWYPKKHRIAADRIVKRIEHTLGHSFPSSDGAMELPGGAAISKPIPYNTLSARKPYMYIGESQLRAYYKLFPVQCIVWMAKLSKSFLLWYWGFRWYNLGPVQVWVRPAPKSCKANPQSPLVFCPGLFLGNTAYMYWIYDGLLPLGKSRPLLLLELPHLSHGIDPRRIGYALLNSWPSTDELSDTIANFLQQYPCPCDIVGNSFGTAVMTALRRDHRALFRKFIYIDPVCFIPCYPSAFLAGFSPTLDSYHTLWRLALQHGGGWPRLKWLFKFFVLRPAIFGDLKVQYVLKRGLYAHELIERCNHSLASESLVLIGRTDELLHDPLQVRDWLQKHAPKMHVHLLDFNHGAIMGCPRPFAKLLWEFLQDAS